MSRHSIYYVGNSMLARLDGLRDNAGDYQSDATVTIESITDADGVEVEGASFPLSMGYVSDTDGRYEAALPDDLEVTDGAWYDATIKAIGADGSVLTVVERIRAAVRRA
jgi:hypothetical protein